MNKINGNKDLYERLCTWMANQEDIPELMDEFPNTIRTTEEAKDFLLDEAMEIMYDISLTCEEN